MKTLLSLFRPQRLISAFVALASASAFAALPIPTTPTTGAITEGEGFTVVLKSDGTVWAWGTNNLGQLGDGTLIDRSKPVQASNLTGIVAVSAGYNHVLALKGDGTVLSWGANQNGQLGDGTTIQRSRATQVVGLSGVVSVSAGVYFSVAVKDDGTVWAWGLNNIDQLGSVVRGLSPNAVQVTGLNDAIAVSAGSSHTLALRNDGSVWAWGYNNCGQLGNGTVYQSIAAAPVNGMANVTAIAAGSAYSLALRNDGTVWAWGNNLYGQLGDGTGIQRLTAGPVGGLGGIVAISTRDRLSAALTADGEVWAWGHMPFGPLGTGTSTQQREPIQLPPLSGAVVIEGGRSHTAAVKRDGTVWACGDDSAEKFGGGTAMAFAQLTTAQITSLRNVSSVSTGGNHTVAVTRDGNVWAWGNNSAGALGDGTIASRSTPREVSGLVGVSAVTAGAQYSVALKTDGTVWSWGSNSEGKLGNNSTIDSLTPVLAVGLTGVVSIATGTSHTLALTSNGDVWAWGWNRYGQLGSYPPSGERKPRLTPMRNAIAIAADGAHSLALQADGTVSAWGFNSNGQLGNGTVSDSSFPTAISRARLSGIVAIAAGGYHSMALKNDGTVWAWGRNTSGQLGDGTTEQKAYPVQVNGLGEVIAIAAGQMHSVALKSDGTVWAWGNNGTGQLGDGTTLRRITPLPVQGLSDIVAITATDHLSLAVKRDGTMHGWGDNSQGQLAFNRVGGPSLAAIRLVTWVDDSDQDALSDAWELQYFGDLRHDGTTDTDGDGLTDIQEKANGSNPTVADADGDALTDFVDAFPNDYFNGATPLLTVVGGNNQFGSYDSFNADPFDIAVWDAAGTMPLVNAPVTFTIDRGSGQLALAADGSTPLASSVSVRTDADGTARAYYRQPSTIGSCGAVKVESGLASTMLFTTSMGLATDDDDGDGVSNAAEIARGTNPQSYYNGVAPHMQLMSGNNQVGVVGNFNLEPFRLVLLDPVTSQPLVNAPVSFAVVAGNGQLSPNRYTGSGMGSSLSLRTGSDGVVEAYYMQPAAVGVTGTIVVAAGASNCVLSSTSMAQPTLDTDGDGFTDWQERQWGSNPFDFYNGVAPSVQAMAFGQSGPSRYVTITVSRTPGGAPLANAPINLSLTTGVGSFTSGSPRSMDVRTNAAGQFSIGVYLTRPNMPEVLVVRVTAGSQAQGFSCYLPPYVINNPYTPYYPYGR